MCVSVLFYRIRFELPPTTAIYVHDDDDDGEWDGRRWVIRTKTLHDIVKRTIAVFQTQAPRINILHNV